MKSYIDSHLNKYLDISNYTAAVTFVIYVLFIANLLRSAGTLTEEPDIPGVLLVVAAL